MIENYLNIKNQIIELFQLNNFYITENINENFQDIVNKNQFLIYLEFTGLKINDNIAIGYFNPQTARLKYTIHLITKNDFQFCLEKTTEVLEILQQLAIANNLAITKDIDIDLVMIGALKCYVSLFEIEAKYL